MEPPLSRVAASASSASIDPIVRNVRAIAALARKSARHRSRLAQVCDRVTHSAGTTLSLALHAAWFGVWIGANALLKKPFDPFPFSLLTSMVSLEAIFLTLFVLNSQDRMTHDADQRAQIDLQVNLLAEQEMTLVLRMLGDLCKKSGVEVPEGLEAAICDVDVERVAQTVERELTAEERAAVAEEMASSGR